MRLLAGAIGVLLLVVLLTWLLLRSIDTKAPVYTETLQAFDDFSLAQASLQRDVLQARGGLLRDYDSLVKSLATMEHAVTLLRAHVQAEGLDTAAVDRLAATVGQHEELTERFKSSNALLQNSLTYVGLLSTSSAFGAEDAQIAPAAGALAAAILYLTRDTSPESVKSLQERIDRFAAQAPVVGRDAEAARAFLAHARLLHEVLPAVDDTLNALVSVPSAQPLEALRVQFSNHRAAIETSTNRFKLILYSVSLLLLLVLVHLGLRLRARALALRRRAAFEHVIAENSTRLITCPPAETDARLLQVLGELCRANDMHRGYVVLEEDPPRVLAWSADRDAYPPGWPSQALVVSAQLGKDKSDIIAVPDVTDLPPGSAKTILTAAGVRGWACVPLIREGRVRGIMGFDTVQQAWDRVFPLAVVRLAGDAVANAIEREFLERDRTRLMTRLERARRMQVVGSLVSGIAHNFNNIIGAILGYSEMVEPQLAPGTKPAQHIDEIRRAAERGRDLVDNILTFGRRRDARVRPLQVRNLFEEAAALLSASLPSGIKLIIDDVPVGLAVSGEPVQLQQIILNLCNNAAQAMQGSGNIRIAAEQKDTAAPLQLSHGELAPGQYVCVAIIDTGSGFNEAVARRLFEPFFTTRSAGTGLGLATVREIVRDHDGAMNVESKPGQGSRFEAWLPASAPYSTKTVGQAALPLGRGETVLIFEREREQRLSDEETLAALGYEPVGFEHPADAIAACRSAPDRFDIIVVSYASRTPDGVELARQLHKIASRQPMLLATASAVDISIDALAEVGILEVLRRPLVSTELAEALARCLRLSDTYRRQINGDN